MFFYSLNNYDAPSILLPVSEFFHLELDKINYIASQITGLCCAYSLRALFPANSNKVLTRHIFSTSVGIFLLIFCFGSQARYLFFMGFMVYIMLCSVPPNILPSSVFAVSMGYLGILHVWRFHHPIKSVDILGPLMIMTQKVTVLAFGLKDGFAGKCLAKYQSGTYHRIPHSILQKPSVLEYISYLFHFQTLLAGPLVFYDDYISFIAGSSKITCQEIASPLRTVVHKFAVAVCAGLTTLFGTTWIPISKLTDQDFLSESSAIYIMVYAYISTSMVRAKYYYAWTMDEFVVPVGPGALEQADGRVAALRVLLPHQLPRLGPAAHLRPLLSLARALAGLLLDLPYWRALHPRLQTRAARSEATLHAEYCDAPPI